MERQALCMAIFMGLYVPILTGISVAMHRWVSKRPEQNYQITLMRSGENNFPDAQLFPLLSHHTFINSEISYQLSPQKLLSQPAKFTQISSNLSNLDELTSREKILNTGKKESFLLIFLLIPSSPHTLIPASYWYLQQYKGDQK